MTPHQVRWRAFKAAVPYTLPILAGFAFLGLTYGIYMHQSGFNFIYPMLMSLTIFAGSAEFIVANLLLQAFNPVGVFFITLIINSRHLFYGLSMLDRYRHTGWKKPYLIFGMCDESFSINYTATIPDGVDRGWFMFFVTALNQSYWVGGATLGGLFGSTIPTHIKGLDFVMTALFIVLCINQLRHESNHLSSKAGAILAIVMLLIVGQTYFIPATMILVILVFTIVYRQKELTDDHH